MHLKSTKNDENELFQLAGRTCFRYAQHTITSTLSSFMTEEKIKEKYFEYLLPLVSEAQTVHSGSNLFQKFPSETAFWYQLNKFQSMDNLIAWAQEALKQSLLKTLDRSKKYILAIDETNDPYYGTDIRENAYVIGGKRKKSTNYFFQYIAISIVKGNERFVLAVIPVQLNTPRVDLVKQLLEMIQPLSIRITAVFLDRGFYSKAVIKYLQENRIPFAMPARLHSKNLQACVSSCKKQTQWQQKLWHNGQARVKGGNYVEVTMGVYVQQIPKDDVEKRKKYQDDKIRFVYVYWGLDSWSLKKIHTEYRHRFEIEAKFRIRNEMRPRTSTRKAEIRYLFTVISFILENIWVALQIKHFIPRKPGPKKIKEDAFRLSSFLSLLNFYLFKKFKARTKLETLR